MNIAYKNLVDSIAAVGEALTAIGQEEANDPIKLLVNDLVTQLNFTNPQAADTLAMLRYAVDNDDASLVKLTEYMTKGSATDKE
jgi:hypothetical protein